MKAVTAVICLFVCVTSGEDPYAGCPTNVPRNQMLVPFRDHCYLFVHHEFDWEDARSTCRNMGGDLASITDVDHQHFLVNTLKHSLHWDKKGVWIGATDRRKEGTWEWVSTGQRIGYSDWHPGQGPSQHGFLFSSGSSEDCGQLRLDDGGRWHDYPCSGGVAYHYSFICEFARRLPLTTQPTSILMTTMMKTTTMPMNETPAPSTTKMPMVETPAPTTTKMPMIETPVPTTTKLPMVETPAPTTTKMPMVETPAPTTTKMPMIETPAPTTTKMPMVETPAPTTTKMPMIETPAPTTTKLPMVETPAPTTTKMPMVETPAVVTSQTPLPMSISMTPKKVLRVSNAAEQTPSKYVIG